MAKSRPFIINERFRLKELYMVEYPRNSRRSQSLIQTMDGNLTTRFSETSASTLELRIIIPHPPTHR